MLKENLNGFLDEITAKIADENISTGVPLSRFSTYRVGGPAALLIKVEDTSVFSLLVKALKKFHLPVLLIGNSIGGVIGLRAAQKLNNHCKGVVLINCAQRKLDDKQSEKSFLSTPAK